MKKLLFATALVASAAAFADGPINAISFEGYTAGNTFANGVAEKDETGTVKTPNGPYFYYDGEQDGSSVKAFGGENAAAPNISPRSTYFSGNNLNYLDLSTEGGILWRGINNITQGGTEQAPTYDLGTAANVSADGIYLDTLVQFTPTEDGGTPELDGEDKLAIWLNVETREGQLPVTNLMVRAGYIDDANGISFATASNFVLNTASPVVAGQWYRLTVKAIADATQCKAKNSEYNPNGITCFEIYLDGVQLATTTTTISDAYIERAIEASEYGWLDQTTDADFITYLQSGKVFPSLKGETTDDTLAAVGFKGSGALDDIVWTTEDPFASSGVDYQVTIGDAVVPITLSAEDVTALGTALFNACITGTDLTTPAGVNAALAGTIGSSGIPVWQAFFLGLPLTEAGLESFKITSISFNEDGEVVVTVPASVTLLTGHGVNIVLSLQGSGDLSSWSEVETATITNDKPSFDPVTPGDATKKFYKIVVSFVQTPVVQGS